MKGALAAFIAKLEGVVRAKKFSGAPIEILAAPLIKRAFTAALDV